jgi:hypothetical protein
LNETQVSRLRGNDKEAENGVHPRFSPRPYRWPEAQPIPESEVLVACDRVTRARVLRATEEYDRLGAERFFSKHDFAPTTTYELACAP